MGRNPPNRRRRRCARRNPDLAAIHHTACDSLSVPLATQHSTSLARQMPFPADLADHPLPWLQIETFTVWPSSNQLPRVVGDRLMKAHFLFLFLIGVCATPPSGSAQ